MISQYAKLATVALAATQVAVAQDSLPPVTIGIDEGGMVNPDALKDRTNPCMAAAIACREGYADLPACTNGDVTFQTDAAGCKCATCKLEMSSLPVREDRGACTLDKVSACREILSSTDVARCDSAEAFRNSFDQDTCCATCRPPEPPVAERPDGDGKCTLEQVKACADQAPVCADDEERQRVDGQCCGSCARPMLACSFKQLAECNAQLPECAEGQLPAFDKTTCCAVCKPARPTCANPCADGERCIGGMARFAATSPGLETPKCVPSTTIRKALKFKAGSELAKFVAGAVCEEVGTMVKEIVLRYCDKPQNIDRCSPVMPAIEALEIKCDQLTPGAAGEVESIDLDIAVPTLDGDAIREKIKEQVAQIRETSPVTLPKPGATGGSSGGTEMPKPGIPGGTEMPKPGIPGGTEMPVPGTTGGTEMPVPGTTGGTEMTGVVPTPDSSRRLLAEAVTTEVIVNEALADNESAGTDVTVDSSEVDGGGSAAGLAPSIVVAIASAMALMW